MAVCHTYKIPPHRVFNLDETSMLMVPSLSMSWTHRGRERQAAGSYPSDKAATTLSLVIPMDPKQPMSAQIVLQGTTERTHPVGPPIVKSALRTLKHIGAPLRQSLSRSITSCLRLETGQCSWCGIALPPTHPWRYAPHCQRLSQQCGSATSHTDVLPSFSQPTWQSFVA